MKQFVAILLFKIGVPPRTTSFIDGETVAYGYGRLYGGVGVWEYQIPFRYTNKRVKDLAK